MKLKLIEELASIVAAIVVMILHEFPKAYVFDRISNKKEEGKKHNIYKIHHYVDPIGLLFCVASGAGFSRPYMYRIKDKKTNLQLGIVGFISLLLTFLVSVSVLRFALGVNQNYYLYSQMSFMEIFAPILMLKMAYMSIGMFLVNLFPLSTSDLGLCVAGNSPSKFMAIIRNDYTLKLVLMLLIIFNIIPVVGELILTQFL